jgi:hypothetical protein
MDKGKKLKVKVQNWPLVSTEEHKLGVFKNGVLRKILDLQGRK